MPERLENRNVAEIHALPTPGELCGRFSASPEARARISRSRSALRDLIHGRDPSRLAVIVGPCSLHDRDSALRYAERLVRVAERTEDELVVIMRAYFEKPRTTVGWKGMLHDPELDGSCDMSLGLERTRELLLELVEAGLDCGSEALDPVTPQYLGDLLAWSAIGARTCESQSHRELASGLSCPVGFKNSTSGQLSMAVNAVVSARSPHTFLGIDADGAVAFVRTTGNADAHVVLRGGAGGANFGASHVDAAAAATRKLGLARGVMVDCSHDNSGKDHQRQPGVCRSVLEQLRGGRRELMGLMLESHLRSGRQDWSPGATLEPGMSITDACIGWEDTEKLLYETAEAVAYTRALTEDEEACA